jgi:predicted RNase H-like HicB family nuclease
LAFYTVLGFFSRFAFLSPRHPSSPSFARASQCLIRIKTRKPENIRCYYGAIHCCHRERRDGYCIGSVVELPGCHTQAKTVDRLMERMTEAVSLYLEASAPVKARSIANGF